MTLADLIRKYLEDRRKACEQKARYVDLPSDNFQFYTDHNQDDNVISLSNNQFFSNNLEPKPNDQQRGSNSTKYQKSIAVSRSRRIVTLPDGTIQVETTIRDSNGNEGKYVTQRKDGRTFTTYIRKNEFGEEVEEKVGEDFDAEVFPMDQFTSPQPFSRSSNPNSDSGYDYWYNKFFKSEKDELKDEFPSKITTYDPNANMDEQIERILKEFGINETFRPFPGNKSTDEGGSFDNGVFTGFSDASINEEMRKIFENFTKLDLNEDDVQIKQSSPKKLERHMDKIFKSLTPPKAPSLFEQFAEDAYLELPEEKTPLDKFVEPDEERVNKLKPMWRKSRDALEKLEKYFTDRSNISADIYSDIEDPKDIDLSLILPETQPELPPTIHNFSDVLRKNFEPDKFLRSGNIKTQMYFGNGKLRSESLTKHADGNTEKNILYQIGDQKYNVKIVTNRFGVEVKREKSLNFDKRDLPNFRKQWGKEFVKDLIDD